MTLEWRRLLEATRSVTRRVGSLPGGETCPGCRNASSTTSPSAKAPQDVRRGLACLPLTALNSQTAHTASLVRALRHGSASGGQWARESAQGAASGDHMLYFAWGGVLGAGLGVAGYACIANMKFRTFDGSLGALWSQQLASLPVATSLPSRWRSWAGGWLGSSEASSSYVPAAATRPAAPLGAHSLADAAARAAPAVVNVTVQGSGGAPFNGACSCSGLILDADGTILTNAHTLLACQRTQAARGRGGEAPSVRVALQDGRVFEGRVVCTDRVSDLAMLKIDAAEALPAARLGSSGGLRVGEWVLALGSPLHLQNSVTAGIVSCVDRKAVELGLAGPNSEFIQTDAAINSGNSGGPLVNLAGEVVGISSMKALTADGVSFAIPIDTAKHVVSQLRAHGRVVRPYIGIKMLQLNAGKAAALARSDPRFPRVQSGILVPQVSPASPAHKAGLRPGDVIVGYNGQRGQATTGGLIRALAEQVGKELELQVLRPDSPSQLTLTVVALEAPSLE